MKKIRTEESVGYELFHDITKIVPHEFKGVAFKRGHLIKKEDIEVLLSIGKDHVYICEEDDRFTHEDDAAKIIKNLVAGSGVTETKIQEGKINLLAKHDGLLKIDEDLLLRVNTIGDIIISTLHNDIPVKEGKKVASLKTVPLLIENEKLYELEKILDGNKIISVIPINKLKVGVVTTGSEVYYGRIKDKFGDVIREKLEEHGCEFLGQLFCPDDKKKIIDAINSWEKEEADMIICTGGMSVDPDDLTPSAILESDARIVSYGSPVLPGAMFLMAYKGDMPIIGLPGGALYNKRTMFDIVFPKILAKEKITADYICSLGHGGLCAECDNCIFPQCSFGRG